MLKITDHLKTNWKQLSSSTRLWLIAGLSGAIYLAFTLPFPLRNFYNIIPPVDYAKLTQHSAFGFIAYLAGILALFGLYILGLRTLANKELDEREALYIIIIGGVIFGLILLFSYPQTAIDLFVYGIRTRGWAVYGLSPFTTPPEALPTSDPWLGLAGEWADAASPYGPVWEWLSLGAYHLFGGKYLAHLINIKVIGLLAYLGCTWMVYKTLQLYRPQWAAIGTAFFAWNPLVLFESVQNAHNDIVMVFFLLVAVWAFANLTVGSQEKRRHMWLGVFIIAFAASILVKFVTVVILPFFLVVLVLHEETWLRRILVFISIGFAITVISVLVMLPYWPGLDQWALLRANEGAGRSLTALLVLLIRPMTGTNPAFNISRGLIYALLGGIYLWCLWQVWRRAATQTKRDRTRKKAAFETPIWASFFVFFWYVLLGASTFHAWYLLWFLPLGAFLIPQVRPISGVVVFSLMALLIIPYFETIRVWLPFLNTDQLVGHLLGVGLLVIVVLFSLTWPVRILTNSTKE
jgi:hypothetical protein